MISSALSAIRSKIASQLSRRPEYFVTHPSELALLQQMTPEEIEQFALENGWRMVRRLGGRQFQFYNAETRQFPVTPTA